MKKIVSIGAVLTAFPVVALAASADAFTILTTINRLVNIIVPILIAVAVVFFIIGVLQYIMGSAEEAKKSGRAKMVNGLIGLFVIIAFWGIIALITTTFGVGPTQITEEQIPCVPGPGVICPQD